MLVILCGVLFQMRATIFENGRHKYNILKFELSPILFTAQNSRKLKV